MEANDRKSELITELLNLGYYKRGEQQLFELTLQVLEDEYKKIIESRIELDI